MKYSDIPKKYIKYIDLKEDEFNNLYEISQQSFLNFAKNMYDIRNKHKLNIYKIIRINYICKKINT